MKSEKPARGPILKVAWWSLFVITVIVVIAARIRLLGIPLERDEGEYAYSGQLMLQGIPPYKLAYNMKFPGTYAAYALLMSIFGQSIAGIHLGLLVANVAAITLIFVLGCRLLGLKAGIAAAAGYAVLSALPYMLGFAAHATHFVMLFVLAGALLLLRGIERPSKAALFGSGMFFGLGLLMKQPAVFFVLFGSIYLLSRDWRGRRDLKNVLFRNFIFLCGAIVPLALTCLLLWWAGVFGKFWFWTVQYAHEYGSEVSPSVGLQILKERLPEVISAAWPLWVIAAAGLVLCLLGGTRILPVFRSNHRPKANATLWEPQFLNRPGFLLGFLACSLLALSGGFYFRTHYFILVLPALSLLIGAAVTGATNLVPKPLFHFITLSLFGLALAFPIWNERDFFFERSVIEAGRMVNGTNPFRESIKVADYLRDRTTKQDTIAVLGSEPQIYFYSHRHSATGYIYTYGLMEPHRFAGEMQHEMMREIEQAAPKYLVLVVTNKSWLVGRDSDRSIFKWANDYCDANYTQVGLVNIFAQGTDYYFDVSPPPFSAEYILIYKRKS